MKPDHSGIAYRPDALQLSGLDKCRRVEARAQASDLDRLAVDE
jgi:hypothetical protein